MCVYVGVCESMFAYDWIGNRGEVKEDDMEGEGKTDKIKMNPFFVPRP